MKCYNHHDRDAYGVCKACGKALCLECMSYDGDNIIYCKNDNQCRQKSDLNNEIGIRKEEVIRQLRPLSMVISVFVTIFLLFFITIVIKTVFAINHTVTP